MPYQYKRKPLSDDDLNRPMSGQTSKETERYIGIKGSAVGEAIKGREGRWDEEIGLRKGIESLTGKVIIEF